MKKRIFLPFLAIVLCLVGCEKEEPNDPVIDPPIPPVVSNSIKAIADAVDYPVLWGDGDSFVQLYEKDGGKLGFATFNIDSGSGSSEAGFSTVTAPLKPLVSLYPSSFLDESSLSEAGKDAIPVIWPSVQKRVGSTVTSCPMYSIDKGTDSPAHFKSIGGILKITAQGDGMVKSVRLKSSETIAGNAVFDFSTAKTVFSSGVKEIVLDCGNGVELSSSGVDFNIFLPCCSVPDASLVFTLNFSGKDVVVSKRIDEDIVIAAGKSRSNNIEVSLDGALVSVVDQSEMNSNEIISRTSEFLVSGINESLGIVSDKTIDPMLLPLINASLSSVLRKIIPEKKYMKLTVEYLTKDPAGNYVTASGLISWPQDVVTDKTYDRIVSVQHGTCDIDQAPTLIDFSPELVPVFARNSRNVVALADYLGYGSSRTASLEHPYMHAKFTGSACADMLRVAETYLASETEFQYADNVSAEKPIGLCGYSQGGQGTMATLYALQELGYTDRIDDVRVGAGPVDLMSMLENFLHRKDYHFMGYLPYTIRGMIYGEQLDVDLHNIYAPEVFESGMDQQFNTTMLKSWHKLLGTDVHKILHPDFFTDNLNGDIQKILEAVRNNSIINYDTPANPSVITLYHETNDEQVDYACSVNASRIWGCKLVDLTAVDNFHLIGAIEFYCRYLGDDIWEDVLTNLSPLLGFLSK